MTVSTRPARNETRTTSTLVNLLERAPAAPLTEALTATAADTGIPAPATAPITQAVGGVGSAMSALTASITVPTGHTTRRRPLPGRPPVCSAGPVRRASPAFCVLREGVECKQAVHVEQRLRHRLGGSLPSPTSKSSLLSGSNSKSYNANSQVVLEFIEQ